MRRSGVAFAAVATLAALGAAWASPWPGPEAVCAARAGRTRQALVLKQHGLTVDRAIAVLSSQPAGDAVSPDQLEFFPKQLPGAACLAYAAGMSGDGTARYYLKQCRKGS